MLKCFKVQITTGFKFSIPHLVKTKGEVRLPKGHRAPVLFFWGWAQRASLTERPGVADGPVSD